MMRNWQFQGSPWICYNKLNKENLMLPRTSSINSFIYFIPAHTLLTLGLNWNIDPVSMKEQKCLQLFLSRQGFRMKPLSELYSWSDGFHSSLPRMTEDHWFLRGATSQSQGGGKVGSCEGTSASEDTGHGCNVGSGDRIRATPEIAQTLVLSGHCCRNPISIKGTRLDPALPKLLSTIIISQHPQS